MANITPISGIKAFLEAATLPASRTALGLGTGDSPTFAGLKLAANLLMEDGNGGVTFLSAGSQVAYIGIYGPAAGIAVTAEGRIGFTASNNLSGGPFFCDAYLTRGGPNTLYQRNSTAAQTYLLANTHTDDNNYERAVFGFESNVLRIGTENLGTGVARFLEFIVGGFRVGGIEDTGVFDITSISATGNINSAADVIAAGTVRSGVYTIANLPFPVAGARAFVSDQDDLNSVYGTPVSASDLNAVTAPVWSDGGGWFVG